MFNYLGMLPQEISAAGQSVVNVRLREDTQLLDEVVVIGYGSAKAKDLTAPIDVVKEKELVNVPTSSPMAALQERYQALTSSIREHRATAPKLLSAVWVLLAIPLLSM